MGGCLFCLAAAAAALSSPVVAPLSGASWEFSRDGAGWTTVRVPHDWAIAGPFDPSQPGTQGKLPWKGEGRYRRTFGLSDDQKALLAAGGRAYLEFDGVMASPRVTLNGTDLGGIDYGYMSFTLDATDAIAGASNLLEVACSTKRHESRWYPGAGIYRDVRLKVMPKKHVLPGTMRIVADVAADLGSAKVTAKYISSIDGAKSCSFVVEKPRLWGMDDPFLYTYEAEGEVFRFGMRTFRFDPDNGFVLNGRRVQLKGVNLHSDLGPLGMAYDHDAMKRQLLIMKDMGFNALRTSHNCPCPDLLDLCDAMGVFVWDECFDSWMPGATGRAPDANLEDYVESNLRMFVRRDRNHPCVFVWSIGNELQGWKDTGEPYRCGMRRDRFERFCAAIRDEDATRPIGIACCRLDTLENLPGLYEPIDVVGWNYTEKYLPFRKKYPAKSVLYTESASAVSEYGYYELPVATHRTGYSRDVLRVGSYDHCAAPWSDIPDHEFARMERDAYCGGEFVWTGIDYLGEPTPIANSKTFAISTNEALLARSSYFGAVDLCGIPKDRFWLYRSYWNKEYETVHLVPAHWNFADAGASAPLELPVYVYTSGDSAELFLNGRSLGKRRKGGVPECVPGCTNGYYDVCANYRLRWFGVRYEPGELKAVAYRDGKVIGEKVVRTAGTAVRLRLSDDPYNASKATTRFVRVEAVDADGTVCPFAANRVSFAISGPGEIVSVGNGNPKGYDSFKEVASHPLHCGICVAVVRRTGKGRIVLAASSPGLAPGELAFNGESPAPGVSVGLDLPPGPDNPRNSEGAFLPLKDGRILYAYSRYYGNSGSDNATADIVARYSSDKGRSWTTNDEIVVKNDGGMNVMSVSLLRLKSGEIALFCLRKNSTSDCRPVMRRSFDEGKTWSEPTVCITDEVAYYVLNNDRVIQLSDGRLLFAVALHSLPDGTTDKLGRVLTYASDNNGKTWTRGKSVLEVRSQDGRRCAAQEPGVVELKDGRILMWIRTDAGRQYMCHSADRGETWSAPQPSALVAPLAPASIKRLPTGDLLAVWNDHTNRPDEARKSPKWANGRRTPLTTAISRDEGRTWMHVRNLEDSPVGWYCYIALQPLDDGTVLFGYCAYKNLAHSRLVKVPLDWLYDRPVEMP